jgi:hypothetical protein
MAPSITTASPPEKAKRTTKLTVNIFVTDRVRQVQHRAREKAKSADEIILKNKLAAAKKAQYRASKKPKSSEEIILKNKLAAANQAKYRARQKEKAAEDRIREESTNSKNTYNAVNIDAANYKVIISTSTYVCDTHTYLF